MHEAMLVEDLRAADHLPRGALRAALANPAAIAGPTLAVLEAASSGIDLDEGDGNLLFWGLHALAHARDVRALPPLLALLREDGETIDGLLGDAVTETLSRVVASLYDGQPGPLFALILDSTVDDFVRQALLAACTTLVQAGRIERAALRDLLVRFDDALAAVEGAPAWVAWEETIALLGLTELAPRAEAARADGRLTDEFSDAAWFKETLARAVRRPGDLSQADSRQYGLLDDPVEALAWTDEDAGQPVRNPMKDVGRNDPCPCGSGLKYKKCCLGKAA